MISRAHGKSKRPAFAIADLRLNAEAQICNLKSAIGDRQSKLALPLAEREGQLQHVDQLSGEQIRDDIVDGSEEPVGAGSPEQHIILARVVQHIDGGLQ